MSSWFQTILTFEDDSNCTESRPKCGQSKDTCVGGFSSPLPKTGHGDQMLDPEGVNVDLEDDEDEA